MLENHPHIVPTPSGNGNEDAGWTSLSVSRSFDAATIPALVLLTAAADVAGQLSPGARNPGGQDAPANRVSRGAGFPRASAGSQCRQAGPSV
ncbi:hypothetical protein GCM10017788_01400 [Amycolatopsis acidiphila]|nr:hypothetical protein GCM10017788_01400 [Amycolatopsis acidiphila]